MFTAIMKVTTKDDPEGAGRVAKYQQFDTKPEADAHVLRFKDAYPDAVVVPTPAADIADWKIVGQTVVAEKRPPLPKPPRAQDIAATVNALEARVLALETGPQRLR